MGRVTFFISRPFSIALGLFIVVNLGLSLREPRLSANRFWLDVSLPEPWLSIFASLLGIALLWPHAYSKNSNIRTLQLGIFSGFTALALSNVIGYYHRIQSLDPDRYSLIPFSFIIVVLLSIELGRIHWWAPIEWKMPREARAFFGLLSVAGATFVMIFLHIYTYGKTDFSAGEDIKADAIVVLGARAYPNGRLSNALQYRMDTALDLYANDKADYLIYSGGVDSLDLSEPKVMRDYALKKSHPKVDPTSNILDEGGQNTYLSAVNCRRIIEERGFKKVFVVSQYYHNARVKLIFERENVPCYTVPAVGPSLTREPFFVMREVFAYAYYMLFHI